MPPERRHACCILMRTHRVGPVPGSDGYTLGPLGAEWTIHRSFLR
jgi:hypothetical protein